MANPPRAMDFREKILRDGVLKHRQTSIALPRWKPRYVVFKVTHSGRLQLTLYKEQPTVPSNEVKEIPIEDFGGLEVNLKLDSEKYTFGIITSTMTDCFAVETPDELNKWTSLLQEYLGKEMILPISIPHKQNNLRSGKAQLRIRNTGFTISTCDHPPRCLGTWQFIHIRKFGGTKAFSFHTGSRCPTGEFLYTIQTEDNARVKSLFSDLSQHKPIFTDDLLGRRMTIERKTSKKETTGRGGGSHLKAETRHSLQPTTANESPSHFHLYENREAVTSNFQQSPSSEGFSTGRRHSAVDGQIFNPLSHTVSIPELSTAHRQGSPRVSRSIEDLSNGPYQRGNRASRQGRRSPHKRVHNPKVMSDPIPEDYYKVSPPPVLKKINRNSSSSPPTSPESENYLDSPREISPPVSEGNRSENEETYVRLNPAPLAFHIEGEHLVINRLSTGSPKHARRQLSPPPVAQQSDMVYQNLDFMRGNSQNPEDSTKTKRMSASSSPSVDSTPPPSQRGSSADVEWAPHNYTNVEFAIENAHGKTGRCVSPRKRNSERPLLQHIHTREQKRSFSPRGTQSERRNPVTDPHLQRKSSAPVLRQDQTWSRDRAGAFSSPTMDRAAHKMVTLGGTPLSSSTPNVQPQIRNSHSNLELNMCGKQKDKEANSPLLDYYNIFAPNLPANASRHSSPYIGLASHSVKAVSSQRSVSQPPEDSPKLPPVEREDTDSALPNKTSADSEYAKVVRENGRHSADTNYASFVREDRRWRLAPSPQLQPGYSSLEEMQQMVQVLNEKEELLRGGEVGKRTPVSYYDHLVIQNPAKSPCYSSVPAPGSRGSSPRPNCYDTLVPIESEDGTQRFVPEENLYDSLLPRQSGIGSMSSSSSPELPIKSPDHELRSVNYDRKVAVLGHAHSYEYIDVEKSKERGLESPRSGTPTRMEHPSEWVVVSPDLSTLSQKDPLYSEIPPLIARVSQNVSKTQSQRKPPPLQVAQLVNGGPEDTTVDETDSTEEVPPALPSKTFRHSSVSEGFEGSPKSPKRPVPLPRMRILTQSVTSETSELLSSTESIRNSRDSIFSNESTSSTEMERTHSLQAHVNGRKSHSPSPSWRDTHEFVALKPRNKIESIKIETVAIEAVSDSSEPSIPVPAGVPPIPPKSSETRSSHPDSYGGSPTHTKPSEALQSPPIPPRVHPSSLSHGHVAERAPPLPLRQHERTTLAFTLPRTEIVFDKPSVTPRPKLLSQGDTDVEANSKYVDVEVGAKYVAVDFKSQMNTCDTYASVPAARTVDLRRLRNSAAVNRDRVPYIAIDFDTTNNLRLMKERVEGQRREEREFIEAKMKS